jgi:hypothetical protein
MVKKLSQILITLALVIVPVSVYSQASMEAKNIFAQAESYYIYEEYELANQLYLLIETPDNMNIKYKIGTCYLNIPSEKEKSIPYLEEAVKSASYDSKTESFKETRAPLDAYFFLAKAYMINNELEKALNTLQIFSNLAKDAKGGMTNLEYVEQQIQACKNAIQFQRVPVGIGKAGLGGDISAGSINENPAVSYDGNTIVYTERRGISNAIMFSKKINGTWQQPTDITAELVAGEDCSSCSLNKDGTLLFIYKTDNYDGAIYSSNYLNGAWTPIKKLNKNINTKFYESHASISSDGKKLYFASNRDGGQGNLDIYVSEKEGSGDWGPAVNLGSDINTPYNEDTPFITENDSILFFSSEGHNSMGGYDLFKSVRNGSGWRIPSNIGYPVNTADDDKFFQPFNNGKNGYFSFSTGYKKKEIFYLDMSAIEKDLNFKIAGNFRLNDTTLLPERKYSVSIINRVTADTIYKTYPDKNTGLYSINVAPGIFRILYRGEGYFSQSIDTVIFRDSQAMNLNFDVTLKRDSSSIRPLIPIKYEKIDLSRIPPVASIDPNILIKNMKVNDTGDKTVIDSEVLYYTVQVIALHNPVDVTYFKYISDMKVIYNDDDKFYRYTTGRFDSKEDAFKLRLKLISKGYPDQIFIKKVSKQIDE